MSGILEKDNKDESDSKHKIVSFDISQAVERYDIVNAPLMIGLYNKNKNENDFLLDYFLVDESHKVLLNQWYIPAETESGKKCDICFTIKNDKVDDYSVIYSHNSEFIYYSDVVDIIKSNTDIDDIIDVKICDANLKYRMTMIILTNTNNDKFVIPYQWTGSKTLEYMGYSDNKIYGLDEFMNKLDETFSEITLEQAKSNYQNSSENTSITGYINVQDPASQFVKSVQEKDNSDTNMPMIIGVVCGIVFVILIVLFVLKKNKKLKEV